MRVGFVGLGAMGAPMARNLLAAGFEVACYDVRDAACDALAANGGKRPATAAAAAEGADFLVLMVIDANQADAVLFSPEMEQTLSADTIVIAMLTQPQQRVKMQADRLAARGVRLLDAPVSGGTAGARAATLTIMSSGPHEAHERALPLFNAMGGNVYWLGEQHGIGSAAKTINQHLAGVHLAAAAEALAFAERAGLPLPLIHDLVSHSAGNSWMWGDRGPRMLHPDPEVTSAVDIFVKDMDIVIGSGSAVGAVLPLAEEASRMFRAASRQGHGKADDSQVIRAYRVAKAP
jgi:3-hydroxyisobutyrate dehydrogenase